jgi:YidC/Oxa1 family membrane protein insertase
MNDSNSNSNFLDSKTLTAVVLVAMSWLSWQRYMQKKYPTANTGKPVATMAPAADAKKVVEPSRTWTVDAPKTALEPAPAVPEETVAFDSQNLAFKISSNGMGLREITLKKYLGRDGRVKEVGSEAESLPFTTSLINEANPLNFKISRSSEFEFVGTAEAKDARIEKHIVINPENYTIETQVKATKMTEGFKGLQTSIFDEVVAQPKRGLFFSGTDHEEFYVVSEGKSHRVTVAPDQAIAQEQSNGSVMTLGSQYFVLGVINRSSILPLVQLQSKPANKTAGLTAKYPVLDRSTGEFSISYVSYVGPKSLALLKSIDEDFAGVINLGIFSYIGNYILKLMILFHDWVGNWGFAIILLTVLVRAVVLPFNVMSYKSMKAMQAIQPHLKELREKYKNDNQKLSVETMNLMRAHKVNPLGGCLPVLLQLPVFWALYQVLGQSIELYRAPFILWIHDLSLKDPYYVLPVLMGITLFFQQRMTPNTMDPVFMISLPSGLTLYIFVSGLFGVTQQLYFMRDRKVTALATN